MVACHGGVIRMILSILLDLPLPRLGNVQVEYASVTQVSWAPDRTRLELLNLTPWRDLPLVV
jgi:broad specificity phosphatase PhoE